MRWYSVREFALETNKALHVLFYVGNPLIVPCQKPTGSLDFNHQVQSLLIWCAIFY